MLYHLLVPLVPTVPAFNVFRYVTFRAFGAALTAFLVSLILGGPLIRRLQEMRAGQPIREDGPQSHQKKAGTPTMGGVLLLAAIGITTLLWASLVNRLVWLALFATFWMGAVGFADDYLKLRRGSAAGLWPRYKLVGQVILGLLVGLYLYLAPVDEYTTHLAFPFFKRWLPDLGLFYIVFAMLVVVGASNAVNLTDGLDGLAIVQTLLVAATSTIFAYVTGHAAIARYLQVLPVRGASELVIFGAAIVGASLGFLWFNAFPAQMFMGDVGSLSLGAALAVIALVTKSELVLVISGGVFVMEAVSVILQVLSYKTRGKRIFRMAPIHHHFELSGLAENKIIVRFWVVGFMLQLVAMATLKLR
jgi:phospho-N-acetylmuramoyl-pentapeptide-transferase